MTSLPTSLVRCHFPRCSVCVVECVCIDAAPLLCAGITVFAPLERIGVAGKKVCVCDCVSVCLFVVYLFVECVCVFVRPL